MPKLLPTPRAARHVVVMTGAGASAESGNPTFRDALTGLWARFDAMSLATPGAFARDPDLVWGWYEWQQPAGAGTVGAAAAGARSVGWRVRRRFE